VIQTEKLLLFYFSKCLIFTGAYSLTTIIKNVRVFILFRTGHFLALGVDHLTFEGCVGDLLQA